MSSAGDLVAASTCAENRAAYVALVELEAVSTFAFQGNHWLADVAPHLLSAGLRERVAQAKKKAEVRREIEAELPFHLLFVKGWPTTMPTPAEAELIASVRSRVSRLLNMEAGIFIPRDCPRAICDVDRSTEYQFPPAACSNEYVYQ